MTQTSEEFQSKMLKPSYSVPVRFQGRIIAETEWTTAKGAWMRFAVYETRGKAYIALIEGEAPGKPDQVERNVAVIKPILDGAGARDEQAMQIGVLDAFSWHDRAKKLLKAELGWAPVLDVA